MKQKEYATPICKLETLEKEKRYVQWISQNIQSIFLVVFYNIMNFP